MIAAGAAGAVAEQRRGRRGAGDRPAGVTGPRACRGSRRPSSVSDPCQSALTLDVLASRRGHRILSAHDAPPQLGRLRRAGRGRPGTVASSSRCVPTAVIRPSRAARPGRRAAPSTGGAPPPARSSCEHPAQRRLDLRLGVDVERRERVVEHQHARAAEHGAGQREPLPLPAGQRQALLADPGVQAARQVVDEAGLRDVERLGDVVLGRRPAGPASGSRARSPRTAWRPRTPWSRCAAARPGGGRGCRRRRSRIRPPVTSYSRGTSAVSVVLPEPVAPTSAIVSPARMVRSTPRSTSSSASGVAEPDVLERQRGARTRQRVGARRVDDGRLRSSSTSKMRRAALAASWVSASSQPRAIDRPDQPQVQRRGRRRARPVLSVPWAAASTPPPATPASMSCGMTLEQRPEPRRACGSWSARRRRSRCASRVNERACAGAGRRT